MMQIFASVLEENGNYDHHMIMMFRPYLYTLVELDLANKSSEHGEC